ncbi:MAG: hypothetical protein ABIP27_20435 [Flavobacterium circumlabens]|uniref:Methyltransferase type 11 n=1 Tax=Flavobacterium circumlabens TaxID=2133765 RepID=A0A4Y7U8N1_9FLAO|nr:MULTISPECIES: hypothetical protein [Flavobacterium]QSB28919.1 hypothetical protein HAV12_009350 [Flavobacterium sp. CLA17]TCN54606.1 hypothetical protein EV142_107106 [Flavobacterium circumlabens]TEB42803.1 hypothetical protein D0809_18220 [Flavobacterium circumlabens]
MIEIFKTNVNSKRQSGRILKMLKRIFPNASFIFDLEDCDKILRVDHIESIQIATIKNEIINLGFVCEILED